MTFFGLILSISLSGILIYFIRRSHSNVSTDILWKLYFYHLFLTVVYYLYALFNPSDSKGYFRKVTYNFRGDGWFDFYGTSTTFIEFVGYPFIKFMGFNYEAVMLVFAFFGFAGFCFFYIFVKENIHFKHPIFGFDLSILILFLPNFHFWTASFGKGSIVFMGIALFFYGLSKYRRRLWIMLIGGLIIYHVRPHVLLVMIIASFLGFLFSSGRVTFFQRILFATIAGVVLGYIFNDVTSMIGMEDELFLDTDDLAHRASDLSKATSGINLENYNFFEKMFAFLYRPLFFDAPGLLGLIVSFENVIYLILTLKILTLKGLRFLINGDFIVKTAIISFLLVSIALAQVSGNLGLAMRQKSQVMPLFIFVILYYLDSSKVAAYRSYLSKVYKERKRSLIKAKDTNVKVRTDHN